jgi:integrase/recombinase XerD
MWPLSLTACPHEVSVEEFNSYLHRMMAHERCSLTYFKHAVFAHRYWFRLYGMEEKAIQMQPGKRKKLPVELSKQECKELFKTSRN